MPLLIEGGDDEERYGRSTPTRPSKQEQTSSRLSRSPPATSIHDTAPVPHEAAGAATPVDSAPTIRHGSALAVPLTTPEDERADPWEELSAATAQSDFSVLKGYDRVPLYERRAQWLEEQQLRREHVLQRWLGGDPNGFDPNRHLPFPITAQFLQNYGGRGRGGGGAKKAVRWKREEEGGSGGTERTVVRVRDNHSSVTSAVASEPDAESPVSERSEPEVAEVAMEIGEGGPPALSRKTSGIPSYDSLFETKWDFDEPLKTPASAGTRRQSFAFPNTPPGLFGHKSYLETRYSEFKEMLVCWMHHGNEESFPLGLFIIFGFLGLALLHASKIVSPSSSIALSNPLFSAAGICGNHACNDTIQPADIALADLPALVSVEASLKETLEAIIARSPASAQLLKQGELAISDLGTVVRHSDLRCKQILGELLEDLATSLGEVGMSLQGFESRAWGLLDQADMASQEVLRDLSALRRQTRYITSLPFTGSGSLAKFQTRQLSSSFRALSILIDSTLSSLISETDALLTAFSDLASRHGPIYALIVQEFTAIERRQRALWTRAPAQSYKESKDLLVLVGGSEEKTRGYAERIGMELGRLRMEMEEMKGRVKVGHKEGPADAARLGEQIEAAWEMVERRTGKRKAGNGCLDGSRRGGGGARNGSTRNGYRGVFKPTRTRSG